ncbi:MAG: FAD-dependent oxidoreductase [Phycisphaerae bacterium]
MNVMREHLTKPGQPGIIGTAILTMVLLPGCATGRARQWDVVVYGASAGGTIAAIAAANEGASVILVEPGRYVGGMVSGGLGATDFGNKSVIGGMSREFFIRTGRHYGEPPAWYFEPHVADQVFHDWLKEARVPVVFGQRVEEVEKNGPRIREIRMTDGTAYRGRVFLDCTYEGDLMARAGVSYTVGREGMDQYGESLAGRRERCEYHQFKKAVSPYDENGKLLPCVYGGDPGDVGQADHKVQAYNFRICLSNKKENQVPFPKPADYDPYRYELLKRYLHAAPDLTLDKLIHITMMPNGKTDVNNNGAFSTDHIGGSWEYPDADYKRRQEIWDDHVSYVQGFFYFLANDPSVPKHIQDELNKWGLAKDEFLDTGHWPRQLYIREARRMVGEYVMRQADLQTDRTKPDSIGMGSYNSDSHHVQRIPTPEGAVINEGDMQVPVQPYEISYRALLPKQEECDNLLVPVCFSASHVAYSSMRMEPQYMIMGHAAGVAAAWAVRKDTSVGKVDIAWLQKRLREQGQVLSISEAIAEGLSPKAMGGVVVDNQAAKLTGEWRSGTSIKPFVGSEYLHDNNKNKGAAMVRFVPTLPASGLYEVRIAYTANPNRATNVPVIIHSAEGDKTVTLNQREAPVNPPFVLLGRYRFSSGSEGYVEIRNDGTDGHVIADAVQWVSAVP